MVWLLRKIEKWYRGSAIPNSRNPNLMKVGGDTPSIVPSSRRKHHWTAKLARWIVQRRKWLIPVLIAAISACACAFATFI